MLRRSLLALGALAAAPARAAEPALLRPHVLLDGETLRLSDLFENAPDIALAPAPAPGRRMVLEAANLWNLSRRHNLGWRPLTPHDRAVVERAGRQVPRQDIEAALREELARQGIDPEMEVELPGFVPPMIPAASWFQVAAEAVTVEQPSLRFQATLVVLADGMGAQRMRLAGRASPTVPVVVATRRLALGEVLGPADVRLTRLRAERVRPGQAQQAEQVVGQELRRPMAADQAFALVDLGPPSIVGKNALVTLLLDAPGITLTAQGRALEAAARGATVPVMNLASRSIVEGVAIAPGRVRVAMGAVPVAGR
ncbi:flagellar basal body P-ring formation chaperone FlgA [Roseococcus sp. YIM B11640]|uniref:flagellar basal body P-ring formation chaperone FlgA n=1 Tax=Roseococcus sp. YIM B11640 TaxID=3133973 RepID=UPI003C7DBB52